MHIYFLRHHAGFNSITLIIVEADSVANRKSLLSDEIIRGSENRGKRKRTQRLDHLNGVPANE